MAILKGSPRHGKLKTPVLVRVGMYVYLARILFERGVVDEDILYRVNSIKEIPTNERENDRTTHWVYLSGCAFKVVNTMVRVPSRSKSTGAKE